MANGHWHQMRLADLLKNAAIDLPNVRVDSYNLELQEGGSFVGDKANKFAFRQQLERWRKTYSVVGIDPLGDDPTEDFSKRDIDAFLYGKDSVAAAVVWSAVEAYACELAQVLKCFLKEKAWKDTECIVVGGGIKDSEFGPLAIARASGMLAEDGFSVCLKPIIHAPDAAGLIGSVQLVPSTLLKGYRGMLAVDIGGTNIRTGIIKTSMKKKSDLSKAAVWTHRIWNHAEDAPDRDSAVKRIIDMLKAHMARAEKSEFTLAPIIGIGCPGVIKDDGAIARGAQNLPGGNWDAADFNLVEAISSEIPLINSTKCSVIVHNDAVVQGASQIPFMQSFEHWAIATIGTGLGNARFTNLTKWQRRDRVIQ